jgi:ABC-type uncharacterized transport system substrate-binding protein
VTQSPQRHRLASWGPHGDAPSIRGSVRRVAARPGSGRHPRHREPARFSFRWWWVGILRAVFGSALLLLGPWPAAGHPHMTVEYTLELLVGPRGPEGLRVTWTIDRDVSEVLLDLFDADRNGALSPAEVRRLEQHVRQEQGRSGFFTAIPLDGVPLATPAPLGFGATVDQGRLKYHFVLPIQAKGVPNGTVDVTVDDPTYFVAFALAPGKPVKVTAAGPFVTECRVVREKAAYTTDVVKCTYTRRGR